MGSEEVFIGRMFLQHFTNITQQYTLSVPS